MNEKLMNIQNKLNAPKTQRNNFGGYMYRNCEDIFNAVKPLLLQEGLTLRTTDELVLIGDRYYIKATAILSDGKTEIENVAYAREEETKKGMDGSQVTGASSSYARKYALNGLFLIDDTKDSDTTNIGDNSTVTKATSKVDFKTELMNFIEENKLDKLEVCKIYNLNAKSTNAEFANALNQLKAGK